MGALKFSGHGEIIYFKDEFSEYRRVEGAWEIKENNTWKPAPNSHDLEAQYKKRTHLRKLIKLRETYSKSDSAIPANVDIGHITRELISAFGINQLLDNNPKKLLDLIDSGHVKI